MRGAGRHRAGRGTFRRHRREPLRRRYLRRLVNSVRDAYAQGDLRIQSAFSYGAAGLAQQWDLDSTVTGQTRNFFGNIESFVYDPSGSTVSSVFSPLTNPSRVAGGADLPNDKPWKVYAFDAYGRRQVEREVFYQPSNTPADGVFYARVVGFGGQWGYYTDQLLDVQAYDYSYASDFANPGLIYCRTRYHDSVNARWLSRDPAGYDGGINVYAYCSGNPVMGMDPSGLWTLWKWLYTGHGDSNDEIYYKSLDQGAKSYMDWQGFCG